MPTCWHCGEEIEFRYVDGRLTPIHLNGGWCQGAYSSSGVRSDTGSVAFNDLCRKTICPQCGEDVFFIRHNGGSVWVDSLGWPWPKHSCMDRITEPPWYKYFLKQEPSNAEHFLLTGVVAKSVWFSRTAQEKSKIILAIDGGGQGRSILSTEGTTTAGYLRGQIVLVNIKKAIIVVSTHDVKPIYGMGIDPEIIGLPKNWA